MKRTLKIISVIALLAITQACVKQTATLSFNYSPERTYASQGQEKDELSKKQEVTPIQKTVIEATTPSKTIEKKAVLKELKNFKKENKEVIKEAKEQFKSLSKQEQKEIKKQSRDALKKMAAQNNTSQTNVDDTTLILALLSIIFPLAPVMMFIFDGGPTTRFWISLILTLLFWLPGVIYNLVVMLT